MFVCWCQVVRGTEWQPRWYWYVAGGAWRKWPWYSGICVTVCLCITLMRNRTHTLDSSQKLRWDPDVHKNITVSLLLSDKMRVSGLSLVLHSCLIYAYFFIVCEYVMESLVKFYIIYRCTFLLHQWTSSTGIPPNTKMNSLDISEFWIPGKRFLWQWYKYRLEIDKILCYHEHTHTSRWQDANKDLAGSDLEGLCSVRQASFSRNLNK